MLKTPTFGILQIEMALMHYVLTENISAQLHCGFIVSFRLQEDPPAGVSGAPSENNIMVWNAVIFG